MPDHEKDALRRVDRWLRVVAERHFDYCGLLGWTVERYGRVTHKQGCPHRTDPWHQGDPQSQDAMRSDNKENIDDNSA